MRRRFTVIHGGLAGIPAPAPSRSEAASASMSRRIDPCATDAVGQQAASDRRPMPSGSAVRDSLQPPGRHRPADPPVTLTLAWSRDAATGREMPRNVVPSGKLHPVWADHRLRRKPGEAGITQRANEPAAPAADPAHAARLAVRHRPIHRVGAIGTRHVSRPFRPRPVPDSADRPRPIPAGNLIGTRPLGWTPFAAEILAVTKPHSAHGAVAALPSLDVRHAQQPMIAAPCGVFLVRVVSRLLGCRGAIPVRRLRREGGVCPPWRRARA